MRTKRPWTFMTPFSIEYFFCRILFLFDFFFACKNHKLFLIRFKLNNLKKMQLIYMMMGLSFGRTVERRSRDAITVDDFNNNFEQYGRPTTYAAYASPTNNDDSSLSREKRVVSQLYQNHKSRVHSVNQTLRLLRAIKKNYEHIYEQVPKRAHFNKKNSGQLRVCTNSLFHPKLFAVKILQSIILFFRENYITII